MTIYRSLLLSELVNERRFPADDARALLKTAGRYAIASAERSIEWRLGY